MESTQARLLFPGLRPFYNWAEPISWLLIRLTAGLMLIPHGWPKLMAGIGPTAAGALAKRGLEPAEPLGVVVILIAPPLALVASVVTELSDIANRLLALIWIFPASPWPVLFAEITDPLLSMM